MLTMSQKSDIPKIWYDGLVTHSHILYVWYMIDLSLFTWICVYLFIGELDAEKYSKKCVEQEGLNMPRLSSAET